jgi:glycosyltransferase involved in cell wall biosynthesis
MFCREWCNVPYLRRARQRLRSRKRRVGVEPRNCLRTTSHDPLSTSVFPFRRKLLPFADRSPLRVMFVITSMPVGGAEMLLVELVRRIDRRRFAPELCCLKQFDRLGEVLSQEVPAFTGLLSWKYDLTVLWRLTRLMRRRRIDAVVTVGAGDTMFWGRLAARLCGVPVICSALHSTGAPDRVEFSNRLLAPLTDAFIAVAEPQARYLAAHEGCPAGKIRVIPNGVDVERFQPRPPNRQLQEELKLNPQAPAVGIVAALRPEKNHEMFLRVAAFVRGRLPAAQFLIVGDGPERTHLESLAQSLGVANSVRFLGTRSDVCEVLSLMDVVLLTSHTEANPICLLEAMASGKPVVATRVGSVSEIVLPGLSGYLVSPNNSQSMADCVLELLGDRNRATEMGSAGREHVIAQGSVDRMVQGYEKLLADIYTTKAQATTAPEIPVTKFES